MKRSILPLLLILVLAVSCTVQRAVTVGMSEEQFKLEHKSARVVELSKFRTVYRQEIYSMKEVGTKFYYFTDGKLALMDEGFLPHGSTVLVPTP